MPTFDFTSRDYGNIRAGLLARADRIIPDWSVRDSSDFGMLLVDLWAQMGDSLHYYADRAAAESFLSTATQRESVLAYASLLGYRPAGRSSSTGTVTVENSGTANYTISKYAQLVARDGESLYYFYVTSDTVIPAAGSAEVPVAQGVVIEDEELVAASAGGVSQRYLLDYANVVASSIAVSVYEDKVTATPYYLTDDLLSVPAGAKAFRVAYNALEQTEVLFGSSVYSAVPQAGIRVTATYAYSDGALGNLISNSVVGFTDSYPGITLTASSAMTGGQNAESISVLKSRIPTAATYRGRAVTLADYANVVRGLASVAKVAVEYLPGLGAGASAANASVLVYPHQDRADDYLTDATGSQEVTSDVSSAVIAALTPRKMLGVEVAVASTITWHTVYVSVTLNLADSARQSDVLNAAYEAVDAIFDFNNIVFGQRMPISWIYMALQGIPGLEYSTVTKFNDTNNSDVNTYVEAGPYELLKLNSRAPSGDTLIFTVVGGIPV